MMQLGVTYIHPDQSGFLKNRHLLDSIRCMVNIISLCKGTAVIAMLDAKKIFDRVEWEFLQRFT